MRTNARIVRVLALSACFGAVLASFRYGCEMPAAFLGSEGNSQWNGVIGSLPSAGEK